MVHPTRLAALALLGVLPAQTLRLVDVPTLSQPLLTFDPARGTMIQLATEAAFELRSGAWHALPGRRPQAGLVLLANDGSSRWLGCGTTDGRLQLWHGDPLGFEPMPATSLYAPRFVAHDRSRNELVTLGSFDLTQPVATWTFDQTWVWNGTAWQRRLTTTVPPAFGEGAMAYDSTRQRVVLVTGQVGSAMQTFEWNGLDWQSIAAATPPPARAHATMAFDSLRGRMVLVGGFQGVALADCWEYDGANWQQRPSMPASGRLFAGAEFDPTTGRTLVLGGSDGTRALADAWQWDGVAWTAGPGFGAAPTAQDGGAAAVEPGGTGVLYHGGVAGGPGGAYSNDTWRWDGAGWTRLLAPGPVMLPIPPAPGTGVQGALLWSQQSQMHLLFGYTLSAQGPLGSLLTYDWPHGMSSWNGTAWSTTPVAALPPTRSGAALAVDTGRNEAVLFGGASVAFAELDDTWVFDGTQWLQRSPAQHPSARTGAAMAFDSARGRVVLFGGYTGLTALADTWEWDGSNWTQIGTALTPPFGSLCFDPVQQRIVLFANAQQNGLPLAAGTASAWTYDGIAWSPMADTGPATSVAALGAFGSDLLSIANGRVHAFRRSDARIAAFGSACSADAALLTASRLPELGAADFALELTHGPASSVALLAGATSVLPTPVPVLGCTLLIDPTQVVVALPTDARGRADALLPVPNLVGLLGAELAFQGATLSASAPAGLTLTRGVLARLGR